MLFTSPRLERLEHCLLTEWFPWSLVAIQVLIEMDKHLVRNGLRSRRMINRVHVIEIWERQPAVLSQRP